MNCIRRVGSLGLTISFGAVAFNLDKLGLVSIPEPALSYTTESLQKIRRVAGANAETPIVLFSDRKDCRSIAWILQSNLLDRLLGLVLINPIISEDWERDVFLQRAEFARSGSLKMLVLLVAGNPLEGQIGTSSGGLVVRTFASREDILQALPDYSLFFVPSSAA